MLRWLKRSILSRSDRERQLRSLFAAGDAAAKGPPLTPVSSHDAKVVVENILDNGDRTPNYDGVPKHLLMIVVLRDEDLEAFVSHEPVSTDDVTRAVTAAALLRERLLVLTRLRHLGVNVVESEHDRLGDRITAAYLDLKRRNLL